MSHISLQDSKKKSLVTVLSSSPGSSKITVAAVEAVEVDVSNSGQTAMSALMVCEFVWGVSGDVNYIYMSKFPLSILKYYIAGDI